MSEDQLALGPLVATAGPLNTVGIFGLDEGRFRHTEAMAKLIVRLRDGSEETFKEKRTWRTRRYTAEIDSTDRLVITRIFAYHGVTSYVEDEVSIAAIYRADQWDSYRWKGEELD